jgi:cell division protein FtsZ
MPIELELSNIGGARLRVVGVGGAGGNAVRTMIARGLEHVEFIAANTDNQALMKNPAPVKIKLGNGTTRGLGAGANPDVGRQAVEESLDEVRDSLEGADMVFVTAGMGGGTGTGAAPVIAREARQMGALVVAIVTKPFSFENRLRTAVAEQGIAELRDNVDALIVIPNDRIISVVDASVPFRQALERADEVLYNATKGIADIIVHEGIINVDFADVVTVMKNQGDAMMGIGTGYGERRAMEAAQNALNSPILEGMQITGAKGLLVNISGGHSLTMHEVNEAISCVQKAAGEEANLIHGVVIDEAYEDEISITVVATGFSRIDATTAQPTMRAVLPHSPTPSAAPTAPSVHASPTVTPTPVPITIIRNPQTNADGSALVPSNPKVDVNDIEQPAVWRKHKRKGSAPAQGYQQPAAPQAATTPAPALSASLSNAKPEPLTPSKRVEPIRPIEEQAQSQENRAGAQLEPEPQPEAFPRPRVKVNSAGGGGNQPAFLRKIMD